MIMKKFIIFFAVVVIGFCAFAEVNAEYGPCPSRMKFALLNADDPSQVEVELQLVNSSLNLNGFNMAVEKAEGSESIQWKKVNRKNFSADGYGHIILACLEDATDEERDEILLDFCDVLSNVNNNDKLVILEILKTNDCRFFPVLDTPTGIGKFYLNMSECANGIYKLRAQDTPSGCAFSYTGGPEPLTAWTADEPVFIKLKKEGDKIFALLGDVNDDDFLTVADCVATASYILERNPQPFIFSAADLDGNNIIDVSDLVAVTSIVLHDESDLLMAPAIEILEAANIAMNAEVSINNGFHEIAINLSNNVSLTAMQMDLVLPEGMTLIDASLTNRANTSHQLDFNKLKNGNYRLLASSPLIKSFNDNDGTVLTLTVAGEPMGQSRLTGIKFVAPNLTSYSIDDVELNFTPTAINAVYSSTRIYNDGSNIVIIAPTDGKAQIILPNGASTTVNVVKGKNVYPAPASGIVFVKMNDEVKKLRL